MAVFLGAQPSLKSCASLGVRGFNSSVLTAKSRRVCASFPNKVKPLRRRLGGVVANSVGAASSVEDETPVKDTRVKEMVDKQMADANVEFSEMDLQEAAEKYSLQEQLFTEVDYAQVNHFPNLINLTVFCF